MEDDVVDLDGNDFGFTMVPRIDPDRVARTDDRFSEIKKLVLPLVDNLMKDPQKDIHWPNRDKKLKEFRRKLVALCGGDVPTSS